jgi:hypothetical protein
LCRKYYSALTRSQFFTGLLIATLTIFTRCVFRVAELQQGFNGELFNDEIAFMVLEGPMIIIASICLTIFHPGLAFKGRWADSTWSLRGRKTEVDETAKDEELEHTNVSSLRELR